LKIYDIFGDFLCQTLPIFLIPPASFPAAVTPLKNVGFGDGLFLYLNFIDMTNPFIHP